MEQRLYWFWLIESGLQSRKNKLLEQYGTVKAIYEMYVMDKSTIEKRECKWFPSEDEIEDRIADYEKKGISFCSIDDMEYPRLLREIYDAPCGLYYRGRLPKEKHSIAVVGARGCTDYGKRLSEKTAEDLVLSGVGVISGMALGIDGSAHKGALFPWKNSLTSEQEAILGRTYAILGNGVDVCYPRTNRSLYDLLVTYGGILSEYPPGTPSIPSNFPRRNRIISGMSEGILVVEARKRSGSLITAELGLEQGRNIYAFPGRPDDVLSEGCNYLIQNGAKLVLNAQDILSDFDFEQRVYMDYGKIPKIILETTEKMVYACLRLEPKHINQIFQESGLSWNEVMSILLKLELKGYAEQTTLDYYVLSRR